MQARNDNGLGDLGNDELLVGLSKVAARQYDNLALLLRYLAEVDTRRLYIEQGCASLFAYSQRFLNFSEDEAAKRIQCARAARTYPLIFELVGSGELHLSGVCLLAPHLTNENHRELLHAARRRTKHDIEQLVASHFPRADAPSRLFRLAAPALRRVVAPLVPKEVEGGASAAHANGTTPASGLGTPSSTTTGAGAVAVETRAMHLPLDAASTPRMASALVSNAAPTREMVQGAQGPATVLEPLSQERFRLLVTLSRKGRDALIEAQRLSGHSAAAKADMAQVIEEAIIAHRDKLAARKFGTSKPKRAGKPCVPVPADLRSAHSARPDTQTAPPSATISPAPKTTVTAEVTADVAADLTVGTDAEAALPPSMANRSALHAPEHAAQPHILPSADSDQPQVVSPKPGNPRYIPRALRRKVAERDNFCCTFVSDAGIRCDCRAGLEFHHLVPVSHGGPTNVDAITLRCRVHHTHQTRLDFGEAKIAAAIAARKKRNPQHESRSFAEMPIPDLTRASSA